MLVCNGAKAACGGLNIVVERTKDCLDMLSKLANTGKEAVSAVSKRYDKAPEQDVKVEEWVLLFFVERGDEMGGEDFDPNQDD